MKLHNFAVEQTAGSQSLARGCSPRRSAQMRWLLSLPASEVRHEGPRP